MDSSVLLLSVVVVLALATMAWYFLGQLREQNHKIESMMSLVSTMAEEVGRISYQKDSCPVVPFQGGGGSGSGVPLLQEQPSSHLIEVSDGEGEEDDDISDIGSEEEDDDEHDEEDGESTDSEEVEELEELQEEGHMLEVLDSAADAGTLSMMDLQNLGLGLDLGAMNSLSNMGGTVNVIYMEGNMEDMPNLLAQHMMQQMQQQQQQQQHQEHEEDRVVELSNDGGDTESHMAAKKRSVQELRQLVQDRGLATAAVANKLKKPELLKLLEG